MYVTDLEEKFAGDGFRGIEVDLLKLFLLLLLYADDIVFFQNLQKAYKKVYIFRRLLRQMETDYQNK